MAELTLAGGLPWLRLADEHRVARSSLHETLTRFVDPLLAHWLVRR
jgi:hypothetical protein